MGIKEGDYVIYSGSRRCELGKVKCLTGDKAIVWYNGGDTPSLTSLSDLSKVFNYWVIKETNLGNR